MKIPKVEYDVYYLNNSNNFEKLDLKICNNNDIDIVIPIQIDEEIIKLYNSLKEQGYDLFDENDKFYLDICSPFTAENGADVLENDGLFSISASLRSISC